MQLPPGLASKPPRPITAASGMDPSCHASGLTSCCGLRGGSKAGSWAETCLETCAADVPACAPDRGRGRRHRCAAHARPCRRKRSRFRSGRKPLRLGGRGSITAGRLTPDAISSPRRLPVGKEDTWVRGAIRRQVAGSQASARGIEPPDGLQVISVRAAKTGLGERTSGSCLNEPKAMQRTTRSGPLPAKSRGSAASPQERLLGPQQAPAVVAGQAFQARLRARQVSGSRRWRWLRRAHAGGDGSRPAGHPRRL